jgi:hypothetical protein
MKKLLLASLFVTLAVAVQAGDAKTSKDAKDQKTAVKADAACCSAKTATSLTKTSATAAEKDKAGCCMGGGCGDKTRVVLFTPKAATLWARK